ncbi:MAG: hypothetical protein HZA80_00575 [Candidatus Taylorbacteria bacterium]|nr:hypothetical protein [Candidatus Taylorbacteria bacterium]
MKYIHAKKEGFILINALVFGVIVVIIVSAFVSWGASVLRNQRQLAAREQAFQIAEAGIDYYRWHLAHAQSDYTDGTANPGPYVHDFTDKDGNVIGQFTLTITPPPIGSTVVKIQSKGTVVAYPTVSRTIAVSLAIPSLAKYAVAANDVMRFGAGTEVFGPIHSNEGIRFDGVAHNLVTSAKDKYIDPDAPGSYRFGVYTQDSPVDPAPPAAVPNRPDVFMAGRQFPVPAVDFTGITANLSQLKTLAQADGRYYGPSGNQGYHIVLKSNDTFDLYRVTSLTSSSKCKDTQNQTGWGMWSIQNQTLIGNYANPTNGIIFLDDHVWVDGTINSARITIAVGRFPDSSSTWRHIIVNNDIVYTNYDGTDALALIAQGDVTVGLQSADDLRIDAALVAQNGRVGRFYYGSGNSACGTNANRAVLTLYGMIASNNRYGFAYTDGTGYDIRNIIYDSNLLYSPPPSFPLTSDQYITVSWDEVE